MGRIYRMQTWYYSKNGEQRGPVPVEELRKLISGGELNAETDLAWTEGMPEWQPTGKITALAVGAMSGFAASGFNPYAAPTTAPDNLLAPMEEGLGGEIVPGSVSLEIMGCIKRGVELTKRHFGTIIVIGIVYLVVAGVIAGVEGGITAALMGSSVDEGGTGVEGGGFPPLLFPIKLVSFIASMVLAAGLSRAALNVCSGKEAAVADLFGQVGKVVALAVSTILFYLMVFVGLFALMIPGIYLALRFSFFITAIVDRNLGPIEALKYSYRITKNNVMSLFGLGVVSVLVAIAGVLALFVGLIFAIPVVTLAYTLAYRFLQYGPVALRDGENSTALA